MRQVYDHYIVTGWSIGAITRRLNNEGVPTRKGEPLGALDGVGDAAQPAYIGTACFGKTRIATRQRVTRRLRLRGGLATRDSANHERPREDGSNFPCQHLLRKIAPELDSSHTPSVRDQSARAIFERC